MPPRHELLAVRSTWSFIHPLLHDGRIRARRAVLALIAALSLVALPAAAQHRVYFYVDCPSTPFSTGHAFMQLVPAWGPQLGNPNLVYGFYPNGWKIFGGAGTGKGAPPR